LSVQGNGSGLDGDTAFLFVGASIGKPGFTSLGGRNDTGTLDKGIGESGLSVIDWTLLALTWL